MSNFNDLNKPPLECHPFVKKCKTSFINIYKSMKTGTFNGARNGGQQWPIYMFQGKIMNVKSVKEIKRPQNVFPEPTI